MNPEINTFPSKLCIKCPILARAAAQEQEKKITKNKETEYAKSNMFIARNLEIAPVFLSRAVTSQMTLLIPMKPGPKLAGEPIMRIQTKGNIIEPMYRSKDNRNICFMNLK